MEKEFVSKERKRQTGGFGKEGRRQEGAGQKEERSQAGVGKGGHHGETQTLFPGFNFNLLLVLQECCTCIDQIHLLPQLLTDLPILATFLPHPSLYLLLKKKSNKTAKTCLGQFVLPLYSEGCVLALECGWHTRGHGL